MKDEFDRFESNANKVVTFALVFYVALLGVGVWAVIKIVNWLTAL